MGAQDWLYSTGGVPDPFRDVREQEEATIRKLREELSSLEAEINLTRRSLALRGAAGYDDFVKAIEVLQARVQRHWMAFLGEDPYLRVLQGKAQALQDVLTIMTRSEKVLGRLVARQEDVQNRLRAVEDRRPKPREVKDGEEL